MLMRTLVGFSNSLHMQVNHTSHVYSRQGVMDVKQREAALLT